MYPSHDGVLRDAKSGKALVFGFLTTEKWWPRIQIGCQNNRGRGSKKTSGVNPWTLYHQCKQECVSGEEVTSETAYINFTEGATAAYKHYTELVAARNTPNEGDPIEAQSFSACRAPITAWTISDTEGPLDTNAILAQTDALAENPLFQPNCPGSIDYIQLDAVSGSELASFTGASTLQSGEETQAIANQIRAKGFKAGIRFNPFCVALDSELLNLSLIHISEPTRPY